MEGAEGGGHVERSNYSEELRLTSNESLSNDQRCVSLGTGLRPLIGLCPPSVVGRISPSSPAEVACLVPSLFRDFTC